MNTRLIARLDIKGENLIKGVHLEGLRVIGEPNAHAIKYYKQGADELIYIDAVATLYGRNHLSELIKKAAKNVFIPITVGGGIRKVEDALTLLQSGADKIAINTAAVARSELLKEISNRFGSQCVVLYVEAKKRDKNAWEVLTDNGRECSGRSVIEWVKEAEQLGAGEILLTSVDKEGTRNGFDVSLVKAVTDVVNIPVIASGGFGTPSHLVEVVREGHASACAIADAIHYERFDFSTIRQCALENNIPVRVYE